MYLPSMQDVLFSVNVNKMKQCYKIVSDSMATLHRLKKTVSMRSQFEDFEKIQLLCKNYT